MCISLTKESGIFIINVIYRFHSENKLFKHLRKTYRKFKISFETTFDVVFQVDNISFAALITNNAKIVTIIHFTVTLRDVIFKPNYNFRN